MSAAAGILVGMDEPRHLRYRDREDSRFYRARGLTPEETWQALGDELARVIADARQAWWRHRLAIDPERIRWWHGAIFGRHFPYDGGRFRKESAYFGVLMPSGQMRQIEGSPPVAVHHDLAEVCRSFTASVDRHDAANTSTLDRTRAVGALYAGILRVHPFADGNHRTAFVTLSATLWSLGLPAVEFADDQDMVDHDDALRPALLSRSGDIEPFAQLLAARIEPRSRHTP
jgi:fido (protein-threonine AMPylation protein)